MTNISSYADRKAKIGARIREARNRLKISQTELASKVSDILNRGEIETEAVSQGTISNWETGQIMPPIEKLACLAEIFECDIGYLLCDHDNERITDAWICDATGLSKNAVNILRSVKENPVAYVSTNEGLNALLEQWSTIASSFLEIYLANANISIVKQKLNDIDAGMKNGRVCDEDWILEIYTALTNFQNGLRLNRLRYNESMLEAFDEITRYQEYDDKLSVYIEALDETLHLLRADPQNDQNDA